MKFNLKNRPKLHGLKGSTFERFQQLFEQVEKTEEWFEGFEKELREKLRHYEFEGQNWELQEILKEILGDE